MDMQLIQMAIKKWFKIYEPEAIKYRASLYCKIKREGVNAYEVE